MKVRISGSQPKHGIARLEAFLAGMILTVSTAYAATICPMVWTQVQLEADLHNRLTITAAVDRWFQETGAWPQEDLSDISGDPRYLDAGTLRSPLTGEPYRLDPLTHRVELSRRN